MFRSKIKLFLFFVILGCILFSTSFFEVANAQIMPSAFWKKHSGATDFWAATSLIGTPTARYNHSTIWTGSRMIVWGGYSTQTSSALSSGAQYDPTTDSWTLTSTGANVPEPRSTHSAVWTGTKMIVWGGLSNEEAKLSSGGQYDPVADDWTTTLSFPIPRNLASGTAVWTGTKMIVWGGFGNPTNEGGQYDPATDTWTLTSKGAGTPSARIEHTAVWTGSKMIVWGGSDASSTRVNSGGQYDPVTDSWTATSTGANVPSGRGDHTAVWADSRMVIWGGSNSSAVSTNTGGRYDPGTDTWLTTSVGANVPTARGDHTAVWTGTSMIVWGGSGTNTGGLYDPTADTWTTTSTGANLPSARQEHKAIWTGTRMIVWGGRTSGFSRLNTGGQYDPVGNAWTATSTGANVPVARRYHTLVWTGTRMIVWGGENNSAVQINTGAQYDPVGNAWTTVSTGANSPTARAYHAAVWSGSRMIVFGGLTNGEAEANGGQYNPGANTWSTIVTDNYNVPQPRESHTAVWTGTRMIIWGGTNRNGDNLNTGGQYDPAANTWSVTSTGANVPMNRYQHTAVWTGSKMVIWGGTDGGGNSYNTGGLYDPALDTWAETSIGTSVPEGRTKHTAVWTGTKMIVWGGEFFSMVTFGFEEVNTGGVYDPVADTWTATSLGANVPAIRISHSATWAGTKMLIWGGQWYNPSLFSNEPLDSGAWYNPGTDTWTTSPSEVDQPTARSSHTAVWTGSKVVIWGGITIGPSENTGGLLNP